jgi:3-oxoadipate enol-lactonase
MPTHRITADLEMHYTVDDFTDPWTTPETILLLHGNAESGLAWYRWVPHLARRFRVVRPDMRGYGRSTPMPRDFPWTLDRIIDDYCALLNHLGIGRCHLVGAKIGGVIARTFAARRQDRIATLSVVGTPPPLRKGAEKIPELTRNFELHGVEAWARSNMAGRLGNGFPPEGVEWWTRFMGRAPLSSIIGFNEKINYSDIRPDIANIRCPTLVITTEGSGLASVQENREWQEQIPNSRLVVLPGNSYHVATTHADECCKAVLDHITRH